MFDVVVLLKIIDFFNDWRNIKLDDNDKQNKQTNNLFTKIYKILLKNK